MNVTKTTTAALAASLLVGASYGAVFAKDGKPGEGRRDGAGHHERMSDTCGPRPMMMHGRAGMFIYALQQFDTNKDGKISKEEAKAAEDKLFAAIDTNKDGVITPGELKKFHEARMEAWKAAWKAEMSKPPATDDKAKGADDAKAMPKADDEAMQGPMDDQMDGCAPRGPGHHKHGMRDGWHNRHAMMGMMGPMWMMSRIDTDENGQISKAEADAALDKLFTKLDTNKDGFISADDFPKAPPLVP
jgi:Ca2+-binding EF-hand superfamily protein